MTQETNLLRFLQERINNAVSVVRTDGAKHFLHGDLSLVEQGVECAKRLNFLAEKVKELQEECESLGIRLDIDRFDAKDSQSSPTEKRVPCEGVIAPDPEWTALCAEDIVEPVSDILSTPEPQYESLQSCLPAIATLDGKPSAAPQVHYSADVVTKTVSRTAFTTKKKVFFERARELIDNSSKAPPDEATTARIKSVVCMGRELLTDPTIDEHSQVVWAEIDLLRHAYFSSSDVLFFGFQISRGPTAIAWQQAAVGYDLLAAAIKADEILRIDPATLSESSKRSLLDAAAAAETFLFRVLHEHSLWAFDTQQVELNKRLRTEATRQGCFVPYWKSVDDRGVGTSEVQAAAQLLPGLLKDVEEMPAKDKRKRQSLVAIQRLISDPFSGDFDFEEELLSRAVECIDAGVSPSKKELASKLVPYSAILAEADEPKLKRLLEAVRAEASLEARKRSSINSDDFPIDGQTESRLKDLQSLLGGKVALFVGGGNKGDRGRREDIQKALHLKELIWPDCEVSTPIARFDADVTCADLVCKVVLNARTGHTAVIKSAKAQGKMFAYLTKGVGVNMVVYDLHRQLIRKQ